MKLKTTRRRTPGAKFDPAQKRDRRGWWTDGILDLDAYETKYGAVHADAVARESHLDDDGTTWHDLVMVRVFETGHAHLVTDLDDDEFAVGYDFTSSGQMRSLADALDWVRDTDTDFDVDTRDQDGFIPVTPPVEGLGGFELAWHWEDGTTRVVSPSGFELALVDGEVADLVAALRAMADASDEARGDTDGEGPSMAAGRMGRKRAELQAWIRSAQDRNVELAVKVREQMAAEGKAPQSWFRISDAAGSDRADVYLYGEIGCWGVTASDFARELTALTSSAITLHVNSPGGEVFDGVAIYTTLKNHKARIDVIVEGLAASAASFIVQAGDSVVMSRGATMMIHKAATMTWGDPDDHRRTADLLDQLSETIADIYVARAGRDVAHWLTLMRAETWMTAAEAVAHGLADKVADDKPAAPVEPSASWDLTVYRYAGRAAAPRPPSALRPVRSKYNPAQKRDDDGQWSDGIPGDKLGLAKRIQLGDGEQLHASREFGVNGNSEAIPVGAAISTPDGPEVRLGIVGGDDTRKWGAANLGGTLKLKPDDVDRITAAIEAENATAKARSVGLRKKWAELERLQELRDNGELDDAGAERLAELDAWWQPFEVDDMLSEGVIPAGEWGDLAYQVWGSDDGMGGWRFELAVRPAGAGAGWTFPEWEPSFDAPVVADMDASDMRKFLKGLKALMAKASPAEAENTAPADIWAELTAPLTAAVPLTVPDNTWAALTAALTNPTAPSSVDVLASLREAL